MKEQIEIMIRSNPYYQIMGGLAHTVEDVNFSYVVDESRRGRYRKYIVYFKFWREDHLMLQMHRIMTLDSHANVSMPSQAVVEIDQMWDSFMFYVAEQAVTNVKIKPQH